MLFGIARLLGSYLFSRYYDDHHFLFLETVLFGFVGAIALLYPASINMYTIILVCAIWGIASMAFQVCFQAQIIGCVSTAASSVAMAIFSAIFNLGIGSGTGIGGNDLYKHFIELHWFCRCSDCTCCRNDWFYKIPQ